MSITDELREWKSKITTRRTPEEVLTLRCEINCIADRIDAEHERGMADAELAAAPTETQLEELGYIELPKDADGVPIHVGDVMENIVHPSTRREVTGVGVECFYAWKEGCGHYSQFIANLYRHVQPDSWERIITDALNAEWGEGKVPDLVERCKRLAGEQA